MIGEILKLPRPQQIQRVAQRIPYQSHNYYIINYAWGNPRPFALPGPGRLAVCNGKLQLQVVTSSCNIRLQLSHIHIHTIYHVALTIHIHHCTRVVFVHRVRFHTQHQSQRNMAARPRTYQICWAFTKEIDTHVLRENSPVPHKSS